jgi:hypothetical protein
LNVNDANGVQRHVDPSSRGNYMVRVPRDRGGVQCFDLRDVDKPAHSLDVRSHSFQLRVRSACDEDLGAFPSERPSDRAADRSTPAVNDGSLVLQQHRRYLILYA